MAASKTSEPSKIQTGVNAIAFAGAAILGLIFLNLIGNRFFKRIDFTQDRIYTLSEPSKDLVRKLPDRLTVKAFISKDLQPPFSQVAQYVRDILDEYATAGKGKMKWEVIDPGEDAKLAEEAQKMKVPKMRRGRVSSNKLEIGSSYLGVAFQYQGNIESIPEINSQEGLEFHMTSIIKKLTVKKKKVAFANSEGELQPMGGGQQGGPGLQFVKQYLDDYDVTAVSLKDKPIPDDVDALVIAGPKQPMGERGKYVIDQFLMKGKSVAFLVDGMVIGSPRGMQMPGMDQPKIGQKNDTGLDDLLDFYGFKVHDDIVMEPRQNVPGPVVVEGQLMVANYPTFVLSTKLQDKSSIMDHVKGVIFPFASSVEQLKGKQPGLQVSALASSTDQAWRQTGFFLFDPQNAKLKVGEDKGPFVFAFSGQGKLKSFFAGKPYPNEKGEKVQPPDPNTSQPAGVERPLAESTGTARLVVISDSDFASDEYLHLARYLPIYTTNLQFFVNMVDWLAQDETLAPIRAKGVQSRPIVLGSDVTPSLIKYANIVGVPLAFIIFGIFRWRLRTARRQRMHL